MSRVRSFNPRTPCGVRLKSSTGEQPGNEFQSTHSLRSATETAALTVGDAIVSIHALLAECDSLNDTQIRYMLSFNPRTPCGVRLASVWPCIVRTQFQSTHSLRSATTGKALYCGGESVSIHALLAECDLASCAGRRETGSFNPRTPCGVRPKSSRAGATSQGFQSTHSLRSATAPNLIHCYSTKQIILCANLPKKTVIARLLFLSIYLSIFYSQCITPIADLPGNSCELEVGAQAMFNSL